MRGIVLILITISTLLGNLKIYSPKAPPSIPLFNREYKGVTIDLYDRFNTAILPKIVKGEEALYIIPTNVAAKLFNKGIDISILATLSEGLLFFCSKEDKRLSEIKDKTIYVPAKGSSPDVITNIIIKKSQNIKIKYSSAPEIAKLMKAGRIDFSVLPQPLASMVESDNIKIFDMKKDWGKTDGEFTIPQVSIVAFNSILESKKIELNKFLIDFEKEIKKINESEELNFERLQPIGWKLSKNNLKRSLKKMNLTFNNNFQSVKVYLEKLYKKDPKLIGGKIPSEKFYKK
ncbi:MAG: hypothetical protein CR982_03855 [Candidatus Cloacimonadota bacterium]|nr:MAG: hypothetical protein CR982_03855 [Candidatus Cloacimonadota bacterium]PIE78019.1 MAG: hypothetical protein CSA15_09990 [Candidatus Delongbacteria bacterium]